jgi:uncharacterized protein (DUF1501 family)
MKRRHFLKAIAAAGIVPLGSASWAASSAEPRERRLIVVMLRGAVDGLNVVVPYTDPTYYRLRPTIAIPRPGESGGALDLDGRFGLHPALSGVLPLWRERTLAFVHAAGSPDPTRSHFDAQDYMESGTPGRKSTSDGWMNRLLATLPGPHAPTRALSIGPVMPRILSGPVSVANLASGAAAARPTLIDRPAIGGAFAQLYSGDDKLSRAYKEAQVSRQSVMAALDEDMQAANNGAPLPNGFPSDAVRLAKLMRKDPRIELAFVGLGGWDTHANQGAAQGQLANRLAPLGEGLAALAQGLGPELERTLVVVMSEFGRTVRQNGNGATDHGHGNVMWLLGGRAGGGNVLGRWPGLDESRLYEGRDLAVTTDYRTVLAAALREHLALSDAQLDHVFPGRTERTATFRLPHA